MRTLWSPQPLPTATEIVLDADESRHAASVLRLQAGAELRLIDGLGHAAVATVLASDKRGLRCRLQGDVETQAPLASEQLQIFVAVAKGSRFEDMVRSLCELAVGRIVPLHCQRSVRDPSLDRARRVAREAAKQCGRARFTEVASVQEFPALAAAPGRLIVLDPAGQAARPGPPALTNLVIGPEGGFTAAERAALTDWGAVTVRLGGSVLRIETAAIAAAAVWIAAWEHEVP